jgi:hypothetical protein
MAAARKAVVESMMASELKAVCQSVDPARCGVRSNKEGLKRRFAGLRTLWKIAILPWLKQNQFAGNRNIGCQDNIQAGFAVMGKCHANPGPVGVFSPCVSGGPSWVINTWYMGFLMNYPLIRTTTNEINGSHPDSAFRF